MDNIINTEFDKGSMKKTTAKSETESNNISIPGITLNSTNDSINIGEKIETDKSTREVVNISDIIPEREDKEIPGVTILESPQAEILKPGGEFDEYVNEKKEELSQLLEEFDAAEELGETDTDEVQDQEEEIDEDEAEILASQDDVSSTIGDVSIKKVSREYESDINKVDTIEESKNELPFYQSTGFKDNYNYPDTYDDLPTYEEDDINETNNDDSDDGYRTINSKKIKFVGNNADSIEELEKEIENDSETPSDDDRLEELKSQISEKIKPKTKVLDLKGWTMATKATSSNKILESSSTSAGKWVLPATGICIQMREVSGQSIEKLRESMDNTATSARDRLKIIYDHIITPKPQSLEAWTKSIAFVDYDHLFMPMYLAAFSDSNYMPQTCTIENGKIARKETGCGKMFLSDNIDIMKCVKFKNDESKKKFWNLYDSDRTNAEGLYASEVIPISDKFAIAFQEPTLYGVLLEAATYGREFTNKYSNIISFIPYISDIYWLDHENKKFVKVSYKEYSNNASKSAKSKVIRYNNIFETFTTDEYMNVVTIINAINEKYDWMTYQIPEMTCPECGRVIPAEEVSASGLVFTRHRLGILANTSIN